ncbi:MAG: serine/threonine-protein kinase [Polyangiales bacterium]
MTEAAEGLASLVGRTVDGRYHIERFVARGGFGVVFRATHRGLGRPVALKLLRVPHGLHGAAREGFLARFHDEARTLARLDHPALVRVTDSGALSLDGDTVPWMVMDWVDGQSLADDLAARRGRGGRRPDEALTLLRGAFEGVAAAHAAGIAHRDLKPSNLMVCPSPAGPVTRVLDFGIAKLMDDDERAGTGLTETRSDAPCFTPGYAAPEQISRARTGPWTDVHALALVLTEVLCDRGAYPDGDVTDVTAAVFDAQRPTPGRHGVDVGRWEPVLARALALRPADRFADAGAFLQALDAATGVAPRGARTMRVAGLAAALGLSLTAALGVWARRPSATVAVPPPTPTPIPAELVVRHPTAEDAAAPLRVDAADVDAHLPLTSALRRVRRGPAPAAAPPVTAPPAVAPPAVAPPAVAPPAVAPPVVTPAPPPRVEIE